MLYDCAYICGEPFGVGEIFSRRLNYTFAGLSINLAKCGERRSVKMRFEFRRGLSIILSFAAVPPRPSHHTGSRREFSAAIRVEHARYYCGFYCHAKVRAYARCGAIRQSVGHNRPDSPPGTKYANSADVGAGPTKTINANDCMCSYIDGFIKISMRTRARG